MQPAPDNVVKVVGDKDALEELRRDLMADPELSKGSVGGITETRPRQIGVEEVIFAIAIHFPVGLTVHFVHDWIKSWSQRKRKNVRAEGEPAQ